VGSIKTERRWRHGTKRGKIEYHAREKRELLSEYQKRLTTIEHEKGYAKKVPVNVPPAKKLQKRRK